MTPCVRSLMTLLTFQRLLTCALSSRRNSWRCQPPSTIKWTNCSSELFPRRVWTPSDARGCRQAGRGRRTMSLRRQRSALPAVTPSGTLEVSSPDCSRRRRTNRSPVRTFRRSDRRVRSTGGRVVKWSTDAQMEGQSPVQIPLAIGSVGGGLLACSLWDSDLFVLRPSSLHAIDAGLVQRPWTGCYLSTMDNGNPLVWLYVCARARHLETLWVFLYICVLLANDVLCSY